ncbi:MAG: radical SAM protein [Theionarchaea archaeon]|nr:radical SAM protein [Theionarchaea archaeon]
MMLHCAPPYRYDHPNAALGYLKGFLEAKGIPAKNVYWNLILYKEIMNWEERMANSHPVFLKLDAFYTTATYVSKHLLTKSRGFTKTPFDTFFSSFLTEEEISGLIASVKNKIDWYIKENNLYKAEYAGFTFKTQQWLMNSYIVSRLKEMNPDIAIIIGGITNQDQAQKFMNVFHQADFAIWGEGEYPLFHLIEALKEGKDLNKVPQLVYRDKDIVSTHQSQERVTLDEYPFADHSDYFQALKQFVPENITVFIPIWGSRSCPWNKCKFCVDNENYQYRTRSPENIIEEIRFQSEKYNIDTFAFVDSELPGNKNRFKTLLRYLIQLSAERNEPYHFFGEVSPIFLNPETVISLRLATFLGIQIGFEAVTDTLLEKMQKRQKFAHNIQALKLGKRYQLNIGGRFILRGTPTETVEDILESCRNLKFLRFLLNTYSIGPSLFLLYKDSPFYNEMSGKEREIWNNNPYWTEISPARLILESDRFEFFGFSRERPYHSLWDDFEVILNFYTNQNYSYTWIEYANGSFIEEKGPKTYQFTLDRDETDILIFCDLVKSYREVRKKFSHISEENLCEIMHTLNKVGFLYYDQNMDTIISVLDMTEKESVSQIPE